MYVGYMKRGLAAVGSLASSLIQSLCLWLFQRIHWTTVSVLVDSKGNKKTAYWYCLSLHCCYKYMRYSVAYCCRDFIVNRRKALLANCLALCYDSWTSRRHRDGLLFQSADRSWVLISCIEQDDPVHGVGGFAKFYHFKTTYWVNHWCENFDCRCKWLVCVNCFSCITPNCLLFGPLVF